MPTWPARSCPDRGQLVLELGGKSGNIVFPDADLEVAGRFAGSNCMGMAGQGCVFPTRLIVHESVHDQIVETAIRWRTTRNMACSKSISVPNSVYLPL
jgi:acyl-CoA reductase-like NAD-dependent aldehyde dehydrogenase